MLYFIAVWILLFVVCGVLGTAILTGFKADSFERSGDRLIAAQWLGVLILSIALLAVSLVLPLSPLVGIGVAGSLVALSFCSQPTRSELMARWSSRSPGWIAGSLGLALAIAAFTSQPVTWIDTGLYHYSVIQWLAQFGAVRGVALLFNNFGFTSSWFALAAPLNADIFAARVSAVTNGFALLLAVLHLGVSIGHIVTRKAQLSDWFILAFLGMIVPLAVSTNLLSQILISPSPDIPAIFLVGVTAWAMLTVASSHSPQRDTGWNPGDSIVPLILAVGAVSIKLIALPLLLVASLFFLLSHKLKIGKILVGAAIASVLIAPLLISGLITSGCPLYPAAVLCIDVPWSPGAQSIERIANKTHGMTSWYGSPPAGVPPLLWSLWGWFKSSKQSKVTAGLIGVSLISVAYLAKTLKLNRMHEYFWIAAIAIVGTAFLLMTSPLFRFGLAYVTLLPALLIAVLCRSKFNQVPAAIAEKVQTWRLLKHSPRLIRAFPLFLSAVILAIAFSRGTLFQILLPAPLKQVAVSEKQVNDLTYLSPQNDELCWATKIPCAFTVAPDVKLLDPAVGIAAGFMRQE